MMGLPMGRSIALLLLIAACFAAGELLAVQVRWLAWAVIAGQAALASAFWIALRRPPPAGGGPLPDALLLVACKGVPEGLRENALSLLSQDYPGRLYVFFVTPSQTDPAYAVLDPLVASRADRARLLASGRRPERSSGKIADLLFALESVPPEAEVLLFADADVRAPADWARSLVGALAEPGAGAATTWGLYLPAARDLPAFAKLLWMAGGMPFFAFRPFVWAGSFAIRREAFDRLKVRELWSRSLLDDGPLDRALKSAGLKVRLVAEAAPVQGGGGGWSGFFSQFGRWMLYARLYKPWAWLAGGLALAGKAYLAVWALAEAARRPWLAGLLGADAAYLGLVVLALTRRYPERFAALHPAFRPPALWGALAGPLLPAVYAACFLSSALVRTLRWGGYGYRIRGPYDITVVGK